jgi:CheY-like chemotaxis protein
VRSPTLQTVLIVDDEPAILQLLSGFVELRGVRTIAVERPEAALAVLESGLPIALVLSDVRMPTAHHGVAFIRTARRRWPDLPLAAVTGYPADLDGLLGTPEWPVLILTKPVRLSQILELLRLTIVPGGQYPGAPYPSRGARVSSRT